MFLYECLDVFVGDCLSCICTFRSIERSKIIKPENQTIFLHFVFGKSKFHDIFFFFFFFFFLFFHSTDC